MSLRALVQVILASRFQFPSGFLASLGRCIPYAQRQLLQGDFNPFELKLRDVAVSLPNQDAALTLYFLLQNAIVIASTSSKLSVPPA